MYIEVCVGLGGHRLCSKWSSYAIYLVVPWLKVASSYTARTDIPKQQYGEPYVGRKVIQ